MPRVSHVDSMFDTLMRANINKIKISSLITMTTINNLLKVKVIKESSVILEMHTY